MPEPMPWKAHPLLCKLSAPLISAPMANVAGSLLAGTVARTGGFGFIGAGMMKKDEVRRCCFFVTGYPCLRGLG